MKASFKFLFVFLNLVFLHLAFSQIDLSKQATNDNLNLYDQFVKNNSPSEDAFIAVQRIAEQYIKSKNWKKAIEIYSTYKQYFPLYKGSFEKIIKLLDEKEINVKSNNLGNLINTKFDEYSPHLTVDGSRLYFTGKNRNDCIGGEDIFVSELKDSIFQNGINLGPQINSESHEYVTSISADDNTLIFFGNNEDSFGGGDLYFAEKTDHGWKVNHFPEPINSPYFDCDGFLTSDGKAFLFVTDRPGGTGTFVPKKTFSHGDFLGNTDIYVSLKTESGWSKPINLGLTINTPYSERTPFLHPDGRNLYFSSDGHPGLGRLDVFVSYRLNPNLWTEWSEPINLGKEINTTGEDYGFTISTSGKEAYFSASNREDCIGGSDLFVITPLPERIHPDPVATIKGRVMDRRGNLIDATIKWEDLTNSKILGSLKTNPKNGTYTIVLPLGYNYGYYAEKEGFYPISKNINLEKRINRLDTTDNFILISLDSTITVNNIFFETGKDKLKSESFPELNRLAALIKLKFPNNLIEIGGHTDSDGNFNKNMLLSKNRAISVMNYLVLFGGCKKENLVAEAYGPTKPIVPNDTKEGKARNRRVEFRVLK